jgi:hypothetical protein
LLEGAKVHDASCMNESVRVQLRAVSRCRSETPSVYLVNLRCKSPHLISATLAPSSTTHSFGIPVVAAEIRVQCRRLSLFRFLRLGPAARGVLGFFMA